MKLLGKILIFFTKIFFLFSIILFPFSEGYSGFNEWEKSSPRGEGGVTAIAFDPANSQTIFAGDITYGIFKSTDEGETWSHLELSPDYSLIKVRSIIISKTGEQIIFAGTNRGIFRSLNGGIDWEECNDGLLNLNVRTIAYNPYPEILYAGTDKGVFKSEDRGGKWVLSDNGLASIRIMTLTIDPVSQSTIYAGTSGRGIYRSDDNGLSWALLSKGIRNLSINSIVINPYNTNIIYIGTNGKGIYKSSDRGRRWKRINKGLAGKYYSKNILAIVMDNEFPHVLYASVNGVGIFKSINGGKMWEKMSRRLPNSHILSLAIDPVLSSTIYAGILRGGVFKSIDAAKNWKGYGFPQTLMKTITVASLDPLLLFTTNSVGEVFKSENGGEDWEDITGLIGEDIEVKAIATSPSSTEVIYVGTSLGEIFKSINRGVDFKKTGFLNSEIEQLVVDHEDSEIVYTLCSRGFYKSSDGGKIFEEVKGLKEYGVSAISIDPKNSNILYAGTRWSGVFKSQDNGKSWSQKNSDLVNENILSLQIDSNNPSKIYIGTENSGVFKSEDGGETWIEINNGISDRYITSLAIDLKESNKIYAGTYSSGVYKSYNEGKSWHPINIGLDDKNVIEIKTAFTSPTSVYAVTSGSGIFKSKDSFKINIIGGEDEKAFKVVNFPVVSKESNLKDILEKMIGSYDIFKWRMFEYNPNSSPPAYTEFPEINKIRPDKGYWIISKTDLTIELTGEVTDENKTYHLTLYPGWNLIGNPFYFPVDFKDLKVADGSKTYMSSDPNNSFIIPHLWEWDSSNLSYRSSSELVPGVGYWVRNIADRSIDLIVPPIERISAKKKSKEKIFLNPSQYPPNPP